MAATAETDHTTDSSVNGKQSQSDSLQEKHEGIAAERDSDEPEYATGLRLAAIMCTVFLTTLLAALDIGIVATAIPGITDDFHQLDDVGWYGSACFLLNGTTSPVWGKLYKYLSARWVYLVSVLLFLIGSILAATAPNSAALIVGRAIQGWGCSGSISGSALMINYVAHPRLQPMLIGLWMSVFMASTIIGPLIGGVFTTEVTWRWCFWINLPVGGPVVVMVLLFFHVPKHIKPVPATWKQILLQLDLPGFSLLLTSLICFTLALQWGGQSKTWNSGSVIATLTLWVVLTVAFFVTEWLQGANAMMPLYLLRSRMTWTNALYAWIVNIADFQILFYLPIYFQSTKGQSAITSGVNSLPFMAFFALGSMLSGFLIGKTRHFQPFMLLSGLLTTAGTALLYTIEVGSSKGRYIGSEVIVGFGIGIGCQIPLVVLQNFSKSEDIASITGIVLMCNSISGAYFVTAAQSIFANRLLHTLASEAPNINAAQVLGTGASEIQRIFSGTDLATVLDAYMVGIKGVFAFSLAGAAFSALLALVVPFKKIPNPNNKKAEDREKAAKL